MRTKACIHTLTGHTSTVAVVKCQAVEPQVSKQATCITKNYILFTLSGFKGLKPIRYSMHSK